MDLHISLAGRKGVSREIHYQIRRAIVAGRLRPGEVLPASRELAGRLGVARSTVTLAYERLAAEGLVEGQVGSGTYVSEHSIEPPDQARSLGAAGALQPRDAWCRAPRPTVFGLGTAVDYDLRTGLPDPSLFPTKRWRQLAAQALRSGRDTLAVYGHPGGARRLREAIARHIALSRGIHAPADDITITSGTQQAIDLVAKVLLTPGDEVAIEDPGYGPPGWLLRCMGAVVRGVPVDREGIVVGAIPPSARLVYVTPSHQYPLGATMSLARRTALIEWADRHDAAIVEDDYDGEFQFRRRPTEAIQTLDRSGRVVYVGSFSKSLSPALRIGFVVTPSGATPAVHAAKFLTDWHTPTLTQSTLAHLIDEGSFARHLRRAVRLYDERHDTIVEAVRTLLGDHLEILPTDGGLHVAARARVASVADMERVVARAREAGIAVHPLAMFAVEHAPMAGLLFGYGAIATERIPGAMERLREPFRALERGCRSAAGP
jgi:GntR family transcriptional regulator/MocR family aminotransferase